MKKFVIIFLLLFFLFGCSEKQEEIEHSTYIPNIYIKEANRRITYFEVHKIYGAWSYSKGKDVKIGIIDHSFAGENNPGLYSETKKFYEENESRKKNLKAEHGFWMASTLKEIAPDVKIYGLDIDYLNRNEDEIIEVLIQAIEWAIENNIKILTYSHMRISERNRVKLNSIIDKAAENELIIIFLHNPNENNFLVSQIEPPIEGINNNPMVNIYDKDYSVILGNIIDGNGVADSDWVFNSVSSKAPVLAGIVAMMLDVEPNLKNEDIRKILIETSYTFENYDTRIENAVNAEDAVKECIR